MRDAPRGPVRVAPGAPVSALLELAEWRLGPDMAREIRGSARAGLGEAGDWVPATIRDPAIRAALPAAVSAIVREFGPVKVVLFGSQARGNARTDSDVDLLVVFERPIDRREQQARIRRLLRDAPFAKDVLAASVADLEHPLIGSALASAIREGVVLYER